MLMARPRTIPNPPSTFSPIRPPMAHSLCPSKRLRSTKRTEAHPIRSAEPTENLRARPVPTSMATPVPSRPSRLSPPSPDENTLISQPATPITTTASSADLTNSPSFPSGHTTLWLHGLNPSGAPCSSAPTRRWSTRGAEYGNDRIIMGAHYAMDVPRWAHARPV